METLRLAGPGDVQLELPGFLWPEGVQLSHERPIDFRPVPIEVANRLLVLWGHRLGPCRRRFHKEAWAMLYHNVPVALAIGASVRSPQIEGVKRPELVELSRIVRHPGHRRAIRAMLRLWTDVLAPLYRLGPRWQDTTPRRAITYSLPGAAGGKTPGKIYELDGWKYIGPRKPWSENTGWGNPSAANDIGDGIRHLWVFDYA